MIVPEYCVHFWYFILWVPENKSETRIIGQEGNSYSALEYNLL